MTWRPREMASMETVVEHWKTAGSSTLPLLSVAARDWNRPFCFRCGWRMPLPYGDIQRPWKFVAGWLERAHLHDHSGGGSGSADNLVPLCQLCHRTMPEFPTSAEPAIAWVSRQEHNCCARWWQKATDAVWGGENFKPYPGLTLVLELLVNAMHRRERFDNAWRAAEDGDVDGAVHLMSLAGVDEESAIVTVESILRDARRWERAA